MSPEEQPSPWAEDTLDNSFLGSGEELDLLTEILGSLSVGTDSMGGLRPSQSLDCCHCGDLDGNLVSYAPPLPSQAASLTRTACQLPSTKTQAFLACPA